MRDGGVRGDGAVSSLGDCRKDDTLGQNKNQRLSGSGARVWSSRKPGLLWESDYPSLVTWFKKVKSPFKKHLKSNSNTTKPPHKWETLYPRKRIKKRDAHMLFLILSHIMLVFKVKKNKTKQIFSKFSSLFSGSQKNAFRRMLQNKNFGFIIHPSLR